MSKADANSRFEELEAGRLLGDLDEQEGEEWKELAASLGAKPDFALEVVAAAVETEYLFKKEESIPPELAQRLRRDIPRSASSDRDEVSRVIVEPPVSVWKRLVTSSGAAWAVAAMLTALLVASFLAKGPEPTTSPPTIVVSSPTQIDPVYAKGQFLKTATNFTTTAFKGDGEFTDMSGEVIWSDEMQEGYMTLTNLPANDPTKKQYQLWIVDRSRDDKPVNGGVFNIPAGQSTAVIAVRNSLFVRDCEEWLITLEQPGGVVVSNRDVLVALAKPS